MFIWLESHHNYTTELIVLIAHLRCRRRQMLGSPQFPALVFGQNCPNKCQLSGSVVLEQQCIHANIYTSCLPNSQTFIFVIHLNARSPALLIRQYRSSYRIMCLHNTSSVLLFPCFFLSLTQAYFNTFYDQLIICQQKNYHEQNLIM